MQVHRSGYYQWLKQPISNLELANQQLLVRINEAFKESNSIYGYRNIHKDLIASGIFVNKKRVARLMSQAKLYWVGTYKRKPRHKAGAKHKGHPNHLQQCFITSAPNENWLYLTTIIDLFSRKVIGWATSNRMTTSLVLNALQVAVQRMRPLGTSVILHSDQGS